jgi:amidophosphoribosyltransferase
MNSTFPSSGCSGCRLREDKPREYCGLFGACNLPNAAELTYYGLYALQHRGQESAGIVSTDSTRLYAHRDTGLVVDIFRNPETISSLQGLTAIGHNRYSTTGSSHTQNIQPLTSNFKDGFLAIAHNGNYSSYRPLQV